MSKDTGGQVMSGHNLNPGDGWRIASADDHGDERAEYYDHFDEVWRPRPAYRVGQEFAPGTIYRVPVEFDYGNGYRRAYDSDRFNLGRQYWHENLGEWLQAGIGIYSTPGFKYRVPVDQQDEPMLSTALGGSLGESPLFNESTTELHKAIDDPALRQDEIDKQILLEALSGTRGDDQQRIARTAVSWATTLLRKNRDYGSSVWKKPLLAPECDPGTAIRVRMSDKLERLMTLLNNPPEVVSESIDDTIGDFGSYCLLELARPGRRDGDC